MGTFYQFGAYLVTFLSRFAPLAWADKNPAGAKKALDVQKRVTAANPTPENERQTLLAQSKFARTSAAYLAKKAETAPPEKAARLDAAAKVQGQNALKAENALRTVHKMNISGKGKVLGTPGAKANLSAGRAARTLAARNARSSAALATGTVKTPKTASAAAQKRLTKGMRIGNKATNKAAMANIANLSKAQAANPPKKVRKPRAPKAGTALPATP